MPEPSDDTKRRTLDALKRDAEAAAAAHDWLAAVVDGDDGSPLGGSSVDAGAGAGVGASGAAAAPVTATATATATADACDGTEQPPPLRASVEPSDSDSDDGGGLAGHDLVVSRLRVLALDADAELAPADLPPDLRRQFEQAVADGSLTKAVPRWRPWWVDPLSTHLAQVRHGGLVTELGAEATSAAADARHTPPATPTRQQPHPFCTELRPAPTLEALGFHGRPAMALVCHAASVVFAYTYTMVLYNGEWEGDATTAAAVLLALSPVVQEDTAEARPDTVRQAVSTGVSAALRTPTAAPSASVATCREFAVAAVAHTRDVFASRHFLTDALQDTARLVAAGTTMPRTAPADRRRQAQRVRRKLRFFVAWAAQADSTAVAHTRAALDTVHSELAADAVGAASRPP